MTCSSWKHLRRGLVTLLASAAMVMPVAAWAQKKVVTVAATEPMTTDNPYADSSGPVYAMWCHIYGCLGRYDYALGKPVGILAESWQQLDALTWRFTLRKGLKRHDGGPGPTSKDVVHTYERIRKDPESQQRSYVANIDRFEEVDDHTFLVKTKTPAVNLVLSLFDRLAVSSAELYARYGREADKKHAFGWGPYQLIEYQADRRVVLHKHPHYTEIDGSDVPARPTWSSTSRCASPSNG